MAEVVSLTNSQYVELLELLTTANHTGGIVYDAIIARVAQLASVDALATLNPTDFLKVWPEGRKQIIDVAVQSPPAGDP
jgi:predicted nucleic acid-binding protein